MKRSGVTEKVRMVNTPRGAAVAAFPCGIDWDGGEVAEHLLGELG
jgi:hypothetical protein